MKTEKLNKLKQDCLTCKKCILGETRNNIVFSDGNPESAKGHSGQCPRSAEIDTLACSALVRSDGGSK